MAGTVLVTGGTGYIAGEVIDQLLGRGWCVRTTVRSKATSEARLRARWPGVSIELRADAGTEQLEARTGAGRFDDRRAEARIGARDALRDLLGEWINGGRADGAHLRTGFGGGAESRCGECDSGQSQELGSHFEVPLGMVVGDAATIIL